MELSSAVNWPETVLRKNFNGIQSKDYDMEYREFWEGMFL